MVGFAQTVEERAPLDFPKQLPFPALGDELPRRGIGNVTGPKLANISAGQKWLENAIGAILCREKGVTPRFRAPERLQVAL